MVQKTKSFSIIFALILGSSLTLFLLLSLSYVPVVHAANITVNTTIDDKDDSNCSLREAVQSANTNLAYGGCSAGSGHDVIQFTLSTPIVLTLTSEILIENDPLTISGPGVDQFTINGNHTTRLFDITPNAAVTLTDMTLQNGFTTQSGGAVRSESPLTINNAVLVNNRAGADGGAIDTDNDLTLNNTNILSNTANGEGGGVNAFGSNTVVNNGRFMNNTSGSFGGGLYVNEQVEISGTHFISNTANQYAGGALVGQGATIINGHFERNSAKYFDIGALYVGSDLQLTDSTFISNTAAQNIGAISVNNNAHVSGSTLTGNIAGTKKVSALRVNGSIWLTDTQFINNQTAVSGGAVVHTGDNGRLVNILFANNKGGAATFEHSGSIDILHNTIVGPGASSDVGIVVDKSGSTFTIKNSIFSGYQTGLNVITGTVSEDYNLYHNTIFTDGVVNSGVHSYRGDPAFVDAANGDYHLSANSEALNTAADLGVDTDGEGDARPGGSGIDLGYDETAHVSDANISKTANTTPGPGQPIEYVLILNNAGTAMLPRLTITDRLPSWIVAPITISSSVPITDVSGNQPYVWQLHNLAPGASETITVSGVLSDVLPQSFTNTVSIGSIAVESNLNNNSDDAVVTVPNVGPVAVDDTVEIDEDETAVFNPTTNDIDGDVLTIDSVSTPGHGTAVISGTQHIVYTPTLNYCGIDSFTYTVNDGQTTDTATVTMTITAVNDAPVINEGEMVTVTISEDNDPTPFSLTLDATDVENNSLTWSISLKAANGTANANMGPSNSSTISYTPTANYFGTDLFAVQVHDGELTDTVAISITIQPINDAPVAVDDTAVLLRKPSGATQLLATGTSASMNLLDNDLDVDNVTLNVTDVGTPDQSGVVNVDTDGTVLSYAPTTDFTGMETFTYTVKDDALAETAVVSMTVTEGIDGGVAGDDFSVPDLGDGQAFSVDVDIPDNVANGDNVALVFDQSDTVQANAVGNMLMSGLEFDVIAYLNGQMMDETYQFDEPITVTIHYANSDLTDIGPSENSLIIKFLTGNEWSSSGVEVIERDNDNHTVTFAVSHPGSFTLFRQGFIYLPMIVNNYVQAPDLVVDSLTVLSAGGADGTPGDLQVVISNVGNGAVTEEFWVDVYIDPENAPTAVNQTWQMLGNQGLVWGVTSSDLPLMPGESLTLTLSSSSYQPGTSFVRWPLVANSPIDVQVDSANEGNGNGAITEMHELKNAAYNNIKRFFYNP